MSDQPTETKRLRRSKAESEGHDTEAASKGEDSELARETAFMDRFLSIMLLATDLRDELLADLDPDELPIKRPD